MNIEEFCIFVHGPFATNIHIDASDVQKIKTAITKDRLSFRQYYILCLLSKEPKTFDAIFNELRKKIKVSNLDDGISHLYKEKYLNIQLSDSNKTEGHNYKINKLSNRPSSVLKAISDNLHYRTSSVKKKFDKSEFKLVLEITDKGNKKYKESGFKEHDFENFSKKEKGDNNEINVEDLFQFRNDVDALTDIKSYKLLKHVIVNHYEEENSFFTEEDFPILLAKFEIKEPKTLEIKDSDENLEFNSIVKSIRFENYEVYLYPNGIGLFTSQVTVNVKNHGNINKIKDKLETLVKKTFLEKFKEPAINNRIEKFKNSILYKEGFKLVDAFELESNKINNLAWIHIIYWFYDNDLFEVDIKRRKSIRNYFRQDIVELLEQNVEDAPILQNRLDIYGWGRSVILTENKDVTKEWVRNKVKLLEIGQYSLFGHILLDSLLKNVITKITVEKSYTKHPNKKLNEEIERLNKSILASTVYLGELQSGINAILRAGSLSFVKTLENHWRLDKIEENIRKKLESLYGQRSSMEKLLISDKRDQTNNITLAFTAMGIATVIAAVVGLSPLNSFINGEKHIWPMLDQISIFIILTIIIITITIGIILKGKPIGRAAVYEIKSKKIIANYNKNLKNINTQNKKENHKQELGKIRKQVKNSLDKEVITKLQHDKFKSKIDDNMAKAIVNDIIRYFLKNSNKDDSSAELDQIILQDPDVEVLKAVFKYLKPDLFYHTLKKMSSEKLLFVKSRIPISLEFYIDHLDRTKKKEIRARLDYRSLA
ncbi:MAG: hypothetical protein ABJB76_07055 [Candidatus Nitrosocosmicus sp.]